MFMDCAACGKQHIAVRYPVLRVSADGEYEELGVCASCRPQFVPVETLFVRLSGETYTQGQRPPSWSNGAAVQWQAGEPFNPSPVPLSEYPLIEDFEILLEGVISKHRLGKAMPWYFVWLFSPSRGYLTHILGADELKDLCRSHFQIPRGDFVYPYHDVDQGWHISMAEDEAFVYVLAGGGPESGSLTLYTTWFRVAKPRYAQQWEQAVRVARALLRKKNR